MVAPFSPSDEPLFYIFSFFIYFCFIKEVKKKPPNRRRENNTKLSVRNENECWLNTRKCFIHEAANNPPWNIVGVSFFFFIIFHFFHQACLSPRWFFFFLFLFSLAIENILPTIFVSDVNLPAGRPLWDEWRHQYDTHGANHSRCF